MVLERSAEPRCRPGSLPESAESRRPRTAPAGTPPAPPIWPSPWPWWSKTSAAGKHWMPSCDCIRGARCALITHAASALAASKPNKKPSTSEGFHRVHVPGLTPRSIVSSTVRAAITVAWPSAAPFRFPVALLSLLRCPTLENRSAREPDFPVAVDIGHHDGNLLTDPGDVFDLLHVLRRQL